MSSYKEGQVHQLVDALEADGYTPTHLTQIGQNPTLRREFLGVLDGTHKVVPITHCIDLGVDPFIPDGWTVEEHRNGGIFEWDASKVELYLDDAQKNGGRIVGAELRKRLASKSVLNANLLDFLLAHPHLIPDSWKRDGQGNTRFICFWGTIYRGSGGSLSVRYLYWNGGRWDWGAGWLLLDWDDSDPAAVRAS